MRPHATQCKNLRRPSAPDVQKNSVSGQRRGSGIGMRPAVEQVPQKVSRLACGGMPVIEPVPMDQIDPVLRAQIQAGRTSGMLSTTVPPQIWAHRPAIASAWLNALAAIHHEGCLDERVRELVRLRIASFTDCRACRVARKSDRVSDEDIACLDSTDERFTSAERAALAFAERFTVDHATVNDESFVELAEHFTTEQIVELSMFCALMLAGGRLTYVLRGFADDEQPTLLH
jgi:alkylhydroperoxidase family enzyme